MSQDAPVPDLLAERKQYTFDEALALHPDLSAIYARGKAAIEQINGLSTRVDAALQAGTPDPAIQESLLEAQVELSRVVDRAFGILEAEIESVDQLRLSVLRRIHADVSALWQSMFFQLHFLRISAKTNGGPDRHERLFREAVILLRRS